MDRDSEDEFSVSEIVNSFNVSKDSSSLLESNSTAPSSSISIVVPESENDSSASDAEGNSETADSEHSAEEDSAEDDSDDEIIHRRNGLGAGRKNQVSTLNNFELATNEMKNANEKRCAYKCMQFNCSRLCKIAVMTIFVWHLNFDSFQTPLTSIDFVLFNSLRSRFYPTMTMKTNPVQMLTTIKPIKSMKC